MHWKLTLLAVASAGLGACAEESDGTSVPATDAGVTADMAAPPTASPTGPPTAAPTAPPGGCADLDGDQYQDAACNANPVGNPRGGDCDDRNNLVNPSRPENCGNQLDDNCNGMVNDGCMEACPADRLDKDGDGFQDAACNANPANGGDCNDEDRTVNPAASEVCGNGKDDDCANGDAPCRENCMDRDSDGYGEGSGCLGADCDDTNARLSPSRSEVCGDGTDQDCSGADLACPADCQDSDHDGFGAGAGCLAADCNDSDATVNPGAVEIPGDDLDQDCNGTDLALRENCTDRDRDGFGMGAGCLGEDCDDGDPRVNAGRTEICGNRKDDDCMGGDRGCSPQGMGGDCMDADGDGFGPGCQRGTVDCDDNNNMVFPDAAESCNGVDDNCNGEVDECARRGQRCVDDRCVSGPGAPCRSSDECDPILGLQCNEEAGECRVADGEPCEDNAQCNPGAECIVLDVCSEGDRRCYQAKGGPCADDCDCTGIYLCHQENGVCVECFGSEQCNDGQTCTPGGYCATDALLSGEDHRVSLIQVIIDCWSFYAESPEAHACASLTLPAELNVGGQFRAQIGPSDDDEIVDFVCDGDALEAAGFSGDDVDVAFEVFGCGLVDIDNIWWRQALPAGSAGEFCVYYAPAKSGFGFPDDVRAAVVVDSCALSNLN